MDDFIKIIRARIKINKGELTPFIRMGDVATATKAPDADFTVAGITQLLEDLRAAGVMHTIRTVSPMSFSIGSTNEEET